MFYVKAWLIKHVLWKQNSAEVNSFLWFSFLRKLVELSKKGTSVEAAQWWKKQLIARFITYRSLRFLIQFAIFGGMNHIKM